MAPKVENKQGWFPLFGLVFFVRPSSLQIFSSFESQVCEGSECFHRSHLPT